MEKIKVAALLALAAVLISQGEPLLSERREALCILQDVCQPMLGVQTISTVIGAQAHSRQNKSCLSVRVYSILHVSGNSERYRGTSFFSGINT